MASSRPVLISCWDGRLYLLDNTGNLSATLDAGGAARLAWSQDGSFAVAGTAEGRLWRVEQSGKLGWSRIVPVTDPPLVVLRPQHQGHHHRLA